jgi:hypothetical protein
MYGKEKEVLWVWMASRAAKTPSLTVSSQRIRSLTRSHAHGRLMDPRLRRLELFGLNLNRKQLRSNFFSSSGLSNLTKNWLFTKKFIVFRLCTYKVECALVKYS